MTAGWGHLLVHRVGMGTTPSGCEQTHGQSSWEEGPEAPPWGPPELRNNCRAGHWQQPLPTPARGPPGAGTAGSLLLHSGRGGLPAPPTVKLPWLRFWAVGGGRAAAGRSQGASQQSPPAFPGLAPLPGAGPPASRVQTSLQTSLGEPQSPRPHRHLRLGLLKAVLSSVSLVWAP